MDLAWHNILCIDCTANLFFDDSYLPRIISYRVNLFFFVNCYYFVSIMKVCNYLKRLLGQPGSKSKVIKFGLIEPVNPFVHNAPFLYRKRIATQILVIAKLNDRLLN